MFGPPIHHREGTMKRSTRVAIFALVVSFGLSLPAAGQEAATKKGGLMLFGGLGLPNGAFAKAEGGADDGYAKSGWFGGAELLLSPSAGFGIVINGRYMQNPVDGDQFKKQLGVVSGLNVTAGSYTGIHPMAGLELYTTGSLGLFVNATAGYMFAKSPEITVSGLGITSKSDAQSGKGLAYGFSAGIDIGNTLVLGGTYIACKPKFDVSTTTGGKTTTDTMEQQMNMIEAWVGIRF